MGGGVNYYEHHLGDWAAATGHLTWDEDMAYTRLLRAYYHHERAIPEGQQYRLAKASTPAQRKAVDSVLSEFFSLEGGAYHQKRADAEIARCQDKQRKASASANARWSKDKQHTGRNANASPDAMRTHSDGNAHQTPDTRHQTQTKGAEDGGGSLHPPRAVSETDLEGHEPTPAGQAWRALRAVGIADGDPGHAGLQRLLDGGVTPDELAATAAEMVRQGKGRFGLVLATVEGRRKDAASAGSLPEPAAVDAWATRAGVDGIAKSLGLKPWDECCHWPEFVAKVRKASESQGVAA